MSAAVLAAASELFAEKGPSATTIRDIATRAHVNHGLVFRHFGTKHRLIGAVLDHLAGQLAALIASGAPSDDVEQAIDAHTRVMARALLDGYPAGQLQSSFPNLLRLVQDNAASFDDDLQARLAVANVVALDLGWRVFRPFLRVALGLGETDDAVVTESVSRAAALLARPQ